MQNIHQILEQYWGYKEFRPLQEDIISSILKGDDTLALLPTGGGKSICYQVPALAKEGVCLVISPLIALMKDQVEGLIAKGIKAYALTSDLSWREQETALLHCTNGRGKFLYISPEKLSGNIFQEKLKHLKLSFIAVDEAHCISQWGYDFRPSYLKIAEIREHFPNIPVLALTATATPQVQKDIQEKLLFKKPFLLKKSFERKNLSYVVFQEESKLQRMLEMLKKVPGSAIVYVRNRRKTKEIATFLLKNKIRADFYHAGLFPQERSKKQDAWKNNKTRVIVSTNAFGMGIDKPDVRLVIHADIPESPEAYFQEAGRAGRDEQKAYAVILYNNADIAELKEQAERSFPSPDEIRKTYQAIANYFQIPIGNGNGVCYDFDIADLCGTYNLEPSNTFSCLKILESEGYFSKTDGFNNPSKLMFTISNEHLYEFQLRNVSLDLIIKTLLRSYGGLFTDFCNINESDISRRCGISSDELIQKLTYLDSCEILSYVPAKTKPQLCCNHERVDAKQLILNTADLKARKERYYQRLNAITDYVTNTTQCRSSVLLSYFGEKVQKHCGVCDVCLEKNKHTLSTEVFDRIQSEINLLLKDKSLTASELHNFIKPSNKEHINVVIDFMLDNRQLNIDDTSMKLSLVQ